MTTCATVLCADLHGYDTLAEKLPPAQLAAMLGAYFAIVTDTVLECGGMIFHLAEADMMAGFGVGDTRHTQIHEALNAARKIQQRFVPVSASWKNEQALNAGVRSRHSPRRSGHRNIRPTRAYGPRPGGRCRACCRPAVQAGARRRSVAFCRSAPSPPVLLACHRSGRTDGPGAPAAAQATRPQRTHRCLVRAGGEAPADGHASLTRRLTTTRCAGIHRCQRMYDASNGTLTPGWFGTMRGV